MAFSITGIWNRITRPGFYTLSSNIPEIQTRGYAARRGTREKALKKKRALNMKRAALAAQEEKKKKFRSYTDITKTIDKPLPRIPQNFDVFLAPLYVPKEYSMLEAAKCHKENLHPSILGVEKAKIQVLIELDMTAEKQTKVINPWKSLICFPNILDIGHYKRLLVLCKDVYVEKAVEAGAELAGGIPLIKKIKKGEVDLFLFDRVIGQLEFLDEISTLRSKLKLLMPRTQDGSLTTDFISAIPRFKYGIEYICNLSSTERTFGWISITVGTADMEAEQVEENFVALLKDINLRRPKREGQFITHVHCTAPPSRENFRIDCSSYLSKLDENKISEEKENVQEEPASSAVAA